MSDELEEVPEEVAEDDRSDEEIVDGFAERRDLETESWIEDGEKYRCPECEAVHEERAGECRVCGWEDDGPAARRD